MGKLFFITCVSILSCLHAPAQPRFFSSTTNFGMNTRCQTAETSDGGWALITTYSYGLNMARYDKCGVLLWAKHYRVALQMTLSDMTAIKSGGFAVTGYYGVAYPNNCDTYILRINDDGSVKFCKVYEAATNEHVYSIGEDSKGNLLVDGNTNSPGDFPGYNYILKTDSLGNYIWCKRYGTGGYWGYGLVCSDDGLLRAQGIGELYKIDENGTLLWAKSGYYGAEYKPIELSDGYAYITSGTYIGMVVKVDLNGNFLWKSKSYLGLYGHSLRNIEKLPSDHIVASSNSFMVELDQNGNYVRHNNLDNPAFMFSGASITDVIFMKDSSLLIAGQETMAFFAKSDLLLHTGCADAALPADTTVGYTLAPANISYVPDNKYFTISLIPVSSVDFDPGDTLACEIKDSLAFNAYEPDPICSGTTVSLNVSSGNASISDWSWFASSCEGIAVGTGASISVSPLVTQNYYVRAEGACDTTACKEVTVNVIPSPQASFEASYSFDCKGGSMHLVNQSQNADNYLWTFSDGSSASQENVDHEFNGNTVPTVMLIASNATVCSDTMTLQSSMFSVIDYLKAAIPNVFSPNNDGLNDEFLINSMSDFNNCFSVKIFDRWGIEMFSSDNMLHAWDGRTPAGLKASPGTYFYIVSVKDIESAGQLTLVE